MTGTTTWVDAVLWLGPEQTLTASQPDLALYQTGQYAADLRRRSQILTDIGGQPIDLGRHDRPAPRPAGP